MKNYQVRRSFEVPDDIIANLWAGGHISGYNYDGRYIWSGTGEYESEKVYLFFSYHSYGERSILFVEGPRAAVDRVCSLLVEKDFVSAKRYRTTAEEFGYHVKEWGDTNFELQQFVHARDSLKDALRKLEYIPNEFLTEDLLSVYQDVCNRIATLSAKCERLYIQNVRANQEAAMKGVSEDA